MQFRDRCKQLQEMFQIIKYEYTKHRKQNNKITREIFSGCEHVAGLAGVVIHKEDRICGSHKQRNRIMNSGHQLAVSLLRSA